MRSIVVFAALCAPAGAHAFCGTYVGGSGDTITNGASYVAFVHDGSRTTLTVANEASGDLSDFALLMPVPQVLPEEAVRVIDPDVFKRLNAYSEPRLVRYECSDFLDDDADTDVDWDTESSPPSDTEVEARYIVGEYEVVILSAQESAGLQTWLSTHGYSVPQDKGDVLQGYIDAGQYFLAARIRPERPLTSGTVLSPLQLEYASTVPSLPIRIGTLDSPGEQDVVIYAAGDVEAGSWGISNYPEFDVPDQCLFDASTHGAFADFYEAEFRTAWQAENGLAWTTEYAWGGGGCDPCPPEPPGAADLVALGLPSAAVPMGDYYFTRLHVRYTPEQATQDLMLYRRGFSGQKQQRYIQYAPEMESYFETCRSGWAEEPGTCEDDDGLSAPTNPNLSGSPGGGGSSCSSLAIGEGLGLLGLWGLVCVGRRRSRPVEIH